MPEEQKKTYTRRKFELPAKFTVLRDTREKVEGKGYTFEPNQYIVGTEIDTLYPGDYSIKGFEQTVVIERKNSTGEFFSNLSQDRFRNEMRAIFPIRFKLFLLEFDFKDILQFPEFSGIPPKTKSKFSQADILKYRNIMISTLTGLMMQGMSVMLAGNAANGKIMAENWLRRSYQKLREESAL